MHNDGQLETFLRFADFLEKEYGLTKSRLRDALAEETLPATIFHKDATPLEAAISYLSSQGLPPQEIAKKIGRSKRYVTDVSSRDKGHAEPTATQYNIPMSALREGAAGPAVASALARQGLSAKEIATMLGKSDSTVRTWLRRAGGGRP